MDTARFEALLHTCKNTIERFVYYKLPTKADSDDMLQEVYMLAFQKADLLKDEASFKPWLLRIARNKCNDYYRARAKQFELPFDEAIENTLTIGRVGITNESAVRDTLALLPDKDKQILYLYYFQRKPQADIAASLGIPLGTVKSRLHTARQSFKNQYPYPPSSKGVTKMKKLPARLPNYKITHSEETPFTVTWEELMGWFLVPRLGEKLSWGMYDMPSRECRYIYDMQVTGKAEVHGIEGIALTANETDAAGNAGTLDRCFIAQLTDTHCRYLASLRTENDVRKYITFLDEDAFMPNWGYGENNCGNEIHISAKGGITRTGATITSANKPFLLDIVGRYTVEIGGKAYDTVCVIDLETCNPSVVSEQYLDKHGRTILWRRFNRDDWAFDRYGQLWSEQLPASERLTINSVTYVHWYDCITDYIL